MAASAFSRASALVAVSPGVADYLHTWPGTRGRVHVVANGVDPAPYDDSAAHRQARHAQAAAGEDETVIGFLGTLKPWHGLPMLVDAFARLHRQHPRTRLLVVGDGPERVNMESALTAQGLLGHCEFTGAVQAREVPALLARMDIATAPYPQQQNFYFSPLKIYEYLAAELPVVTTRVGHLDTVVLDGVDGLLVPPGDPDAFAAALARLLENPSERRAMGQRGRTRVLAEHSWDAVTARLLDIAGATAASERAA